MEDRSEVMLASDLMKLAHPAFCSWGTSAPVLSVIVKYKLCQGHPGGGENNYSTKEECER
jgi:hypothetical protein